jgi:hypothetical protein
VFTAIRPAKEEPSSIPAASPRLRRSHSPWPPGAHPHARPEVPRSGCPDQVRTAPGPYPPDLSRQAFKGRNHAGSSRTPLRHARRTHTIWQCWRVPALSGLLPPIPALPGSGCPQLRRPAATRSAAEGLSPPLESSAPHGARRSRLRYPGMRRFRILFTFTAPRVMRALTADAYPALGLKRQADLSFGLAGHGGRRLRRNPALACDRVTMLPAVRRTRWIWVNAGGEKQHDHPRSAGT